jgi:hypothetical protein
LVTVACLAAAWAGHGLVAEGKEGIQDGLQGNRRHWGHGTKHRVDRQHGDYALRQYFDLLFVSRKLCHDSYLHVAIVITESIKHLPSSNSAST